MAPTFNRCLVLGILVTTPIAAYAQASLEDYRRATGLREKYEGLATNIADGVTWIDDTHGVW